MGKEDLKCKEEPKRVFLKECYLQKTNQFDALKVIDDYNKKMAEKKNDKTNEEAVINPLGLGHDLTLCREEYDEKGCVFAMSGDKRIGIISEDESKDIMKYLIAGWKRIFECRISKVDEKGDENKRYSVAIFITPPNQ